MPGPLEVTKYSLESAYQLGEEIIYNIFITNTGVVTLINITVEENPGTYAIILTTNVTPLTYVGPAKTFIDNTFSAVVTGNVATELDSVTFQIGSLTSGSTMLHQYISTGQAIYCCSCRDIQN